MLVVSVGMLLVFNLFFFGKSSVTVLKGYNWFINAVITAAVVVYHFPVALLNIVFVFPLLHNCVSLFGWNKSEKADVKQKVFSLAFILVFTAISVVFLLGPVILKNDFEVSHLRDMLLMAIKDTQCTGSNLYIYFCTILVPNVLTIV
jgi:hypothetical protein